MNKIFALGTILTVTTGRLLTKPNDAGNGIEDLYQLLGHMTGEPPYTHSLGRFSEECKPSLLKWFPELASVDETELDELMEKHGDEGVQLWLDSLDLPKQFSLAENSVPHVVENPIVELARMVS